MTFKSNSRWFGPIIGAILATALGLFLHAYTLGKGLTQLSYNFLLVLRGEIDVQEAVLVYLDEGSFQALNQPLNLPFDRSLHAHLIDRLTAAGARAIVFDIIFSDPAVRGPAVDSLMSEAMARSGRVILAADNVPTGPKTKRIIPPIELFQETAASMGTAELEADRDLIVRRHTTFDPTYFPTLGWAAAEYLQAPVTLQTNSVASDRWMNYYGGANFLPATSYERALDPAAVTDGFFSNKVVFIGARLMTKAAAERKDEYVNPYGFWSNKGMTEERGGLFMAGVEIQTTALLNLLRGDWLVRTPRALELAAIVLIGIITGAGLVLLRPVLAAPAGLMGLVGVAAGSYLLFSLERMWSPWLIVQAQVILALTWALIYNSVQLYVQKRLAEQSLALYLSPKLVKKFAKNPKLLQPGAEKQEVTALFSDIANFTSISEGMDSDELARLMNSYFQKAVSKCIHKTDGTVVKYIGDAVFSFWNAPEEQGDHQARACEAALLFRDHGVEEVNGVPLFTRIGLHTGVANVGNFGSTERVDYTALGETINLAARMEGLNKYLGTKLLITGETKAGIGNQFQVRFLGLFRLKGFERSVEVYELLSLAGPEDPTRPWREAFDQALASFRQRDFDTATARFKSVLNLIPEDGPSTFYLAKLDELRGHTLPETWKGEVELKEK